MTWASFLTDDIADRRLRSQSVAAILSSVLHAGLVGVAFAELPWSPPAPHDWGVDVTVELAPQVDEVSPPLEAQLAIPEPAPLTALLPSEVAPADSPLATPSPDATLAPATEVMPQPQPQRMSAALVPEPPSLEKALPAADAPPAVEAHDFAQPKPAPAKPPAPPRAQTAAIQPPPVTRPAPESRPAAARRSDRIQQKADEDYFWQLVRRISQYRFYSQSAENAPRGLVVTRMTIGRDGRLLDVALVKSSGFPDLDNAVVQTIRQASPFAPLPVDLAQNQKTFIVPVNYTRER